MSKAALVKGLATAGLIAASSSMALAADIGYGASAPVLKAPAPAETPYDILFGVTLTTDYISRGITQTDHGPAVQGYVEFDIHQFYASLWASNIDINTGDSVETDWTIGWRPTLGPFALDLGYVRYVYFSGSASDYGEAFIKATINPVEPLTLGAQFWINPENSDTYIEGNAAYALPHNFKVSGAVGVVNSSTDYVTGNIGLSWTWNDTITLDGRVWTADSNCQDPFGNSCGTRVVGSISLNSSFKKLGLIH